MTTGKTFELQVPVGVKQVRELLLDNTMTLNGPLQVGPRSTVVLM